MGGGRKVFFFMRGPMARSTQPDVNQHPPRVAPRPAVPGAKGPSIWDRLVRYAREVWAELKRGDWPSRPELVASTIVVVAVLAVLSAGSEERRVGEEGRSRWAPYHLKKKKEK